MSSSSGESTSSQQRAGIHRKTWRSMAGLAAIAVVVASCGGSDGSAKGNSDPKATDTIDASVCPVDALDKADGPVDITVWHAWVGKTADTIEGIAADYNASQDKVKVNVQSQGNYDEMLKKYTDAMADPKTLPDLIMNVDTSLQFMIDSETAIPAAACIKADPESQKIYDDIIPAVTSAYTVQDVLWPGAFSVSEPVLYVNKSHFQAAGLSTDDLPKNLEELRAASEKIMEAKKTGVPELQGVTQPMVLRLDSWYLEHWMTGDEVPIVNNENGRSGLATKSLMDSPTVTTSFDWFKSMNDSGLLKAVPYSKPFDQLFAMALGSSSMLIDTSTAITTVDAAIAGTLNNADIGAEDLGIDLSSLKGTFDSLSIGVGLNPGLTEAGKGQIGGAAWYLVDRDNPETIAATWDFIKYSNDTPQQVRWTLEGSYLPTRKSALDDKAIQEDFKATRRGGWMAIATSGLDSLDPKHPGPVIGPYNEFRKTYRDALEHVTLGGKDVASTVKSSNEAFQQSLDRYKADVEG
ncbi:MAG TPA: extracellular solute-binding protein [Microthrixaceae bacterium]|nr:extracellular solute-binding protein [Microthrixaceae bacterium]